MLNEINEIKSINSINSPKLKFYRKKFLLTYEISAHYEIGNCLGSHAYNKQH